MTRPSRIGAVSVYTEIARERRRQDRKWGQQNHPSLDTQLLDRGAQRMAEQYEIPTENRAKFLCEDAFKKNEGTWAHIALEEFCEAVGSMGNTAHMRMELVQLAAVIVAWIECIDRKAAAQVENQL